jgi:hypothetical protein
MSEGMQPHPMPTEELADLLARISDSVRDGYSLEGSIEYLLPGPDDDVPEGDLSKVHMVRASYRIGGPGQGSIVMVGSLPGVPESAQNAAGEAADEVVTEAGLADGPWKIEACNSCRKAVVWARTETGRSMPVDAAPTREGNLLLTRSQGFARVSVCKGSILESAIRGKLPLRTSHFATCPDADTWRKR